jgi:hypothetical protein
VKPRSGECFTRHSGVKRVYGTCSIVLYLSLPSYSVISVPTFSIQEAKILSQDVKLVVLVLGVVRSQLVPLSTKNAKAGNPDNWLYWKVTLALTLTNSLTHEVIMKL